MLKLVISVAAFFLVIGPGALAQAQESQEISTRFGVLSVNDDKMLLFKGQPLSPPIEGNNSLDLGAVMHIGATDVVLVTDNGGTGCPALLYFVSVNQSGVKATPPFGTCSDLTTVKRKGNSIYVTMPGFRGPAESESAKHRAARQRHVFVFRAGVVTENGKPVK
jgi:hypothetical protein